MTVSRSYDFRRRVRPCTRTSRPPKYYIIDFGLSRRYPPTETSPLELIILGGDKTVPEHKDQRIPQNPFWTDIYYLGNMIREDFMQVCFISALRYRLLGLIIAELFWLRLHEAAYRGHGAGRPVEEAEYCRGEGPL